MLQQLGQEEVEDNIWQDEPRRGGLTSVIFTRRCGRNEVGSAYSGHLVNGETKQFLFYKMSSFL